MNKLILSITLLAVVLTGCDAHVKIESKPSLVRPKSAESTSSVPTVPQQPEPQLTDKQKIALLRAEAHKRHLRWRVWCVDLGEDWQFQGWAVQPGDDFRVYAEDGAKPNWGSHGATEAETAYNLYLDIQQPPTEPMHELNLRNGHKKHCPPELRGD